MANILVRRDQFNITPQGIVHKPTDAAFTPYPGDPFSGLGASVNLAANIQIMEVASGLGMCSG
jgi:hypothetical protein